MPDVWRAHPVHPAPHVPPLQAEASAAGVCLRPHLSANRASRLVATAPGRRGEETCRPREERERKCRVGPAIPEEPAVRVRVRGVRGPRVPPSHGRPYARAL